MVVNNIIIKKKLLRWYDLNRRILPWRVRNNKKIDPYKVLISESFEEILLPPNTAKIGLLASIILSRAFISS